MILSLYSIIYKVVKIYLDIYTRFTPFTPDLHLKICSKMLKNVHFCILRFERIPNKYKRKVPEFDCFGQFREHFCLELIARFELATSSLPRA